MRNLFQRIVLKWALDNSRIQIGDMHNNRSATCLDNVLGTFSYPSSCSSPQWYDPETDPSQFMAALWNVRHLCTRAEYVRMKVPGSHMLVQAIMSAIDDYAERETGNREYFWNKPHKAG